MSKLSIEERTVRLAKFVGGVEAVIEFCKNGRVSDSECIYRIEGLLYELKVKELYD